MEGFIIKATRRFFTLSLAFEQRKKTILSRLATEERIYVPELANLLEVSTETIRRDLDRLEKQGKLKKVYGGAVLKTTAADGLEPSFETKRLINQPEKQAIAKAAASLIEDGDIIMIGNGTTSMELVRYISDRKNVSLITLSVPVLNLALEVFKGKIIFVGGEVDTHLQSTYGSLAQLTLKQMRANKAFIGVGGISAENGISDYELNEAQMSQILMERCDELIVMADHTKFGESTFAHICELEKTSVIVSDWNCPAKWKKILKEHHVSLLLGDKI